MKTFAFYIGVKDGGEGQRVTLPDGRTAYLRIVQARDGVTDEEALDEATSPRPGEQFMNTHTRCKAVQAARRR